LVGVAMAAFPAQDAILNPQIQRNLADKLYEKRKQGALEVEAMVKEWSCSNQQDKKNLVSLINFLSENFMAHTNPNYRKGGLIALAAVAIGLGGDIHTIISDIVDPILRCFIDTDPRVRYYACESLYNVAKVSRGKILTFFNDIFDGMCKLCADSDLHVKNGTKLLDRLIKDIISETPHFDTQKFIPLLQERITSTNPFVRQFLLGWVGVLASLSSVGLVKYLPLFLDGVLCMLSDHKNDLQKEAEVVLDEFLRQLKAGEGGEADYGRLLELLVPHATSTDDLTRLICVSWMNELTIMGQDKVLPFLPKILEAILPGFSDDIIAVQEQTAKANQSLLVLLSNPQTHDQVKIGEVVDVLTALFQNQFVATRIQALKWVVVLHETCAKKEKGEEGGDDEAGICGHNLLPSLLKNLSDPSDDVVRLNIQVLALIFQNGERFQLLINTLVQVFRSDLELLEKRGSLIIRLLSVHLQAERIYRTIAPILEKEEDLEYASLMVQSLNFILLTSRELFEVRENLKNLKKKDNLDLFVILYRSWCHNPCATLSLCLLACVYEQGTLLIGKFAELEITVGFLVEIDKLVQLLESPIFTSLRLQLLEPQKYPFLYKCLYGLLMLLPQSGAFETLRNRLNCTPPPSLLPPPSPPSHGEENDNQKIDIDFEPLLSHFVEVQERHVAFRLAARQVAAKKDGDGSGINNMGKKQPQQQKKEGEDKKVAFAAKK